MRSAGQLSHVVFGVSSRCSDNAQIFDWVLGESDYSD